jgi:hypothetical protein
LSQLLIPTGLETNILVQRVYVFYAIKKHDKFHDNRINTDFMKEGERRKKGKKSIAHLKSPFEVLKFSSFTIYCGVYLFIKSLSTNYKAKVA